MSVTREKSEPFYKVIKEVTNLHDEKGEAYEGTGKVYSNYRRIEKWVPALVSHPELAGTVYALMRAEEKLERIRNILEGANPGAESVEDTLKDISIIPLIALLLYRERGKEDEDRWQRG